MIFPCRGWSVIQDPLLPQHCDEGHEQCDGQTGEEDGLSFDDAGGNVRDGSQRVDSTERGVLLQYTEQQGVRQIDGVWLEFRDDLGNECGSDAQE
jgi:hypothetical protein